MHGPSRRHQTSSFPFRPKSCKSQQQYALWSRSFCLSHASYGIMYTPSFTLQQKITTSLIAPHGPQPNSRSQQKEHSPHHSKALCLCYRVAGSFMLKRVRYSTELQETSQSMSELPIERTQPCSQPLSRNYNAAIRQCRL
jgi:hypothetical protein